MRTRNAFAPSILATLLACGACAPKYYAPNTHNVPLLARDGDYSAALVLGDSRGELQGAYAVRENLGLLLNAAYFLPVVYRAFFRPFPVASASHGEAPWVMVGALTVTAMLTVLMFLAPELPLALARSIVKE